MQSVRLIIALCLWSCFLCLTHAQSGYIPNPSLNKAWGEIEKAQEKRLLQDVIHLCDQLSQEAGKLKRFDYLLLSTITQARTEAQLDPQKGNKLFQRLADLRTIQWMNQTDQAILSFALCDAYVSAWEQKDYILRSKQGAADSIPQIGHDPSWWDNSQFQNIILALSQEVFAQPALLNKTKASSLIPLTVTACEKSKSPKATNDESLLALFLQQYARWMSRASSPIATMNEAQTSHLHTILERVGNEKVGSDERTWLQMLTLEIRLAKMEMDLADYSKQMLQIMIEAKGRHVASLIYSALFSSNSFVQDENPHSLTTTRGEALTLGKTLLAATSDDVARSYIRNTMIRIGTPIFAASLPPLVSTTDSLKLQINRLYGIHRLHCIIKQTQHARDHSLAPQSKMLSQQANNVIATINHDFEDHADLQTQTNLSIPLGFLTEPGTYELSISAQMRQPLPWHRYQIESVKKYSVVVSHLFSLEDHLQDGSLSLRIVDHHGGSPVRGSQLGIYSVSQGEEITPIAFYPANSNGIAAITKEELIRLEEKHRTQSKEKKQLYNSHNGLYYRPVAPGDISYPLTQINTWGDRQWNAQEIENQINLYTDRSVYRPGSKVQIAGFAYQVGYYSEDTRVLANTPIRITLTAVNGHTIDTVRLRTDKYGDFATTFTLPSRTLGGAFSAKAEIENTNGRHTSTNVSFFVEEYKQPTFEATLSRPEGKMQIGQSIPLKGQATLYSGIPLSDASVQYTISVNKYHRLHLWRPNNDEEIIVQTGSLSTDNMGKFIIPLELSLPKPLHLEWEKLMGKDLCYMYKVEATVIASNGETHKALTVVIVGEPVIRLNLSKERSIVEKSHPERLSLTYSIEGTANTSITAKVDYELSHLNDRHQPMLHATVTTDAPFTLPASIAKLSSGSYLLKAKAYTTQGDTIPRLDTLVLFSASDHQIPNDALLFAHDISSEYDTQQTAEIVFGSSLEGATLFYDLSGPKGIIERQRIDLKAGTLHRLKPAISKESLPPLLTVALYLVRDGKLISESFTLKLKDQRQDIQMVWSTFRDKLQPGTSETWVLKLLDSEGRGLPSARLATWMYDGSLDAIRPYFVSQPMRKLWIPSDPHIPYPYPLIPHYVSLNVRYTQKTNMSSCFYRLNSQITSQHLFWSSTSSLPLYGDIPYEQILDYGTPSGLGESRIHGYSMRVPFSQIKMAKIDQTQDADQLITGVTSMDNTPTQRVKSLRSNFVETAFFYPHLTTDSEGQVQWSFILPDAVTRWHLQLLAHTTSMQFGYKQERIEASKQLMIVPNLPRFLREGDKGTVAATIYNHTDQRLVGNVYLEVFDPITDRLMYESKAPFATNASSTTAISFPLQAIDGYTMVGIRLRASTSTFSDGEQHLLQQLPANEPIHHAIPFALQGGETKTIDFSNLVPIPRPSDLNITIEHEGSPLWSVLSALPTLSHTDSENAITLAAGIYSNLLAEHLLSMKPIRTVIESFIHDNGDARTDTISALRYSSDAYGMLTTESPWLTEMRSEERRAAVLKEMLDGNSLKSTTATLLSKLLNLQRPDGGIAWYPSMNSSYFVSAYFVQLIARYTKLTGELPTALSESYGSAWAYLDKEMQRLVKKMKQDRPDKHHTLPQNLLHYLYLSSLCERTKIVPPEISSFALPIMYKSMPKLSLYELPYAALIAKAEGKADIVATAAETLRQHLTYIPDQGAFFAFDPSQAYSWYDSRYPLQTSTMELFSSLQPTKNESIRHMRQWLLSQKRVQMWPSTPATTDIIYALLMQLDKRTVDEATLNAFIGIARPSVERLSGADLAQDKLQLVLTNKSQALDHGSIYLDYKDHSSIYNTKVKDLPLTVQRRVYHVMVADSTQKLKLIDEGDLLKIGDEIRIEIIFKLDRAMDFIVLTDSRSACTEHIGELTGYKYGNGTPYYYEAKDTKTRFYFDSLQRGEYRLSYSQRIVRSGIYQSGRTMIHSAYTPSFTDNIHGIRLQIKGANK